MADTNTPITLTLSQQQWLDIRSMLKRFLQDAKANNMPTDRLQYWTVQYGVFDREYWHMVKQTGAIVVDPVEPSESVLYPASMLGTFSSNETVDLGSVVFNESRDESRVANVPWYRRFTNGIKEAFGID